MQGYPRTAQGEAQLPISDSAELVRSALSRERLAQKAVVKGKGAVFEVERAPRSSYGIASPRLRHQCRSGMHCSQALGALGTRPGDWTPQEFSKATRVLQISTVVEAAKKPLPVKKAQKAVKKVASKAKTQVKGGASGAAFWYGPDRPGFLGKLRPRQLLLCRYLPLTAQVLLHQHSNAGHCALCVPF